MTRRIYLVPSGHGALGTHMRLFLANGQQIRGVASIEARQDFGQHAVVTLTLVDTKVITKNVPPKRRIATRRKT